MERKIVAIGGGKNGRMNNGVKEAYETGPIDQKIIRLTNKKTPNFLFLAHAQENQIQKSYYQVMKDIYDGMYHCPCRMLRKEDLDKREYVHSCLEWADIIYEGGGNTMDMIQLWKETGFDTALRNAWIEGKVLCGVSAGANCWFKECSTDSLQIKYGKDYPIVSMPCLGFVDGYFVPHCDEEGRKESAKELLKESDQVGLLLSNGAALEIVDDQYQLVLNPNLSAYGIKAFWKDNQYYETSIPVSGKIECLTQK